jgi:HPt (histidine-containing phosphotransfer) domain-containing protein
MNGFVAKPVRKVELVAALLRVLSGPSAAGHPTTEVPQQQGATDDASLDIFNRETYDKLAGEIGEDGAREMLELFVAETDRRIALLRRLSCELDRPAIVREAHALKGDAGAFGLVQLTALARALERDAKRMTDGEYRTALDRIEPAYAIARDRLPKQAAPAA